MAVVGRVARPHGLRGQVVVNPDTDFPRERFRSGTELFLRRGHGLERKTVDSVRFQQDRPVLSLSGVDTVEAARELAGAELLVPRDQLEPLPQGAFYLHDLIGCGVELADGKRLGLVTDVQGSPGGARWLVVASDKGEILVPLAVAICPRIEQEARRIVIDPPAGLLDLNVN
jgi:16S rRNA processing protein RimM